MVVARFSLSFIKRLNDLKNACCEFRSISQLFNVKIAYICPVNAFMDIRKISAYL